jgi:hypothetical protein
MVRLRTVGFLQQGIRWPVPIVLASCASVALTVGLFVYAVDRGKLLGSWPLNATVAVSGSLFGMLGYWLPSFIHPFAFGLLTAAARPSGLRPAYRACVAWWAVNVAFEVGQHPLVSARLANIFQSSIGTGAFQQSLSDYFTRGTFDVGDLLAATAGAAAAAGVLWLANYLEGRDAR